MYCQAKSPNPKSQALGWLEIYSKWATTTTNPPHNSKFNYEAVLSIEIYH